MRAALLAKFTSHADLSDALLAFDNEELVENAPTNYFLGCGQLGGGQYTTSGTGTAHRGCDSFRERGGVAKLEGVREVNGKGSTNTDA